MNIHQSSSKKEQLYSPYNLPQLNNSGYKASQDSPQSKQNSSFSLYYSSANISPQNKLVRVSSELFATERKVPSFEKIRRSLIAASSTESPFSLTKSSSFGSLLAAQSTRNHSKLLPSIQLTHSTDTQSSLMDVSLSPKKPNFNVSLQQIQSPNSKGSDKKAFSIGNEFQHTLGEIKVLKYIEKQNETIAKLTQRIQSQERREKQRRPRFFEDKEEAENTSISMDPLCEGAETNGQPCETAFTLKDVALAGEEIQKQEGALGSTNGKKRKSILKVSTRGQGSTLCDLIKLQHIQGERRDSSRSSRVTFAEDEANSAKSEKDDFDEATPTKTLFVSKSVSDCSNMTGAEVAALATKGLRDKRFLVPRRSLFEPQTTSQQSTRKNSDPSSETHSEDSSNSPKRERRSIRRVGKVTLPGRSKLGKILTTKVYQDEETAIQGVSTRQKLNGVLWAMVFPTLLSSKQC